MVGRKKKYCSVIWEKKRVGMGMGKKVGGGSGEVGGGVLGRRDVGCGVWRGCGWGVDGVWRGGCVGEEGKGERSGVESAEVYRWWGREEEGRGER